MIAVFPFRLAGVVIVLGLTAVAAAQDYERSPNDIGGVGAQGEIGRGVSAGERPSAWGPISGAGAPRYASTAAAAPIRYVYVYVQPSAPASVPAASERPAADVERTPMSELALVRYNPYRGFHRSWLHGFWNARTGGTVANRAAAVPTSVSEPGMGQGWGLPAWLTGPMVYRWGYYPYANPYAVAETPRKGDWPGAPDYSRPIDVETAPPTEILLNEALQHLSAAREAFRREDYATALQAIDDALVLMPQDPAIHQLRALTLLSLHRYGEAAAVYHAVIAVVPGWDWTTMIRLYGNPEIYTHQLRMLEAYSGEHPGSAEARFLLAVHYLTAGYPGPAADELHELAELQPDDLLISQLLRELRPSDSAASTPAPARSGEPGTLEGTWLARPRTDTTILLTFQARGRLECRVHRAAEETAYHGFHMLDRGTLVLAQDQDNIITGELTWTDPSHFRFKLFEGWPDEPALSFEKSK